MNDLTEECDKKIAAGDALLDTLNSIENLEIDGLKKLKTKIQKEINFLIQTRDKGLLKKEHISGTNLNHFEALVSYLLRTKECTSVLKVFHFRPDPSSTSVKRVDVDVVSEKKKKWTKVVARNPKALSIISKGEGGFGQKSIVDHAVDYLECAKQNTHLYKAPYVEFFFGSGVEVELAELLVETGVHVGGRLLSGGREFSSGAALSPESLAHHLTHTPHKYETPSSSSSLASPPPTPCRCSPLRRCSRSSDEISKLNLDVTTMISYVSALTNGHENLPVRGKMLQEQAAMERERPLKPLLDKILTGKELYACKSAVESFKSLVGIMGGRGERARADELVARMKVVDDALVHQDDGRRRSSVVFATGAKLKAVTVTANKSYVNSAAMQGLHFEVIIHEPRGLSESKEITKEADEEQC